MSFIFASRRKRKKFAAAEQPVVTPILNGFGYVNPIASPPAVNWGTWLKSQPAPRFKPGHRLAHLSVYLYGGEQEYDLSLDLAERWGYTLNTGYNQDPDGALADALTGSPATSNGKLVRKAIQDPNKYPVAGIVRQPYPSRSDAPDGFIKRADGVIMADWSPEATPSAMQKAMDARLATLRGLVAAGANVVLSYDGGETGIHVPGDKPEVDFGADPKVLAAKDVSGLSWVDYVSKRKGEHLKFFYEEVKRLIPNRETYVFYPTTANPYSNIPGVEKYGWYYRDVGQGSDMPSGSVYYKDIAASGAGMTNPNNRDRAYYDQLTYHIAAVGEQIQDFGKPLTYNFVCAGYGHGINRGDGNGQVYDPGEVKDLPNQYFMSIDAYKGFLKCMYASGMIGGVASYFSPDCAVREVHYTPFENDKPPHWLRQQTALAEIHARFSWFDDFIFNGDLLPGSGANGIKPDVPAFEYSSYRALSGFLARNSDVRVLVRKHRTSQRWLIVICRGEKLDGTAGDDLEITVRDIPELGILTLKARGVGSIYTVNKTSGDVVIVFEDELT